MITQLRCIACVHTNHLWLKSCSDFSSFHWFTSFKYSNSRHHFLRMYHYIKWKTPSVRNTRWHIWYFWKYWDLGYNFNTVGKPWLCKCLKYVAAGGYSTADEVKQSLAVVNSVEIIWKNESYWSVLLSSCHCRDNGSNAVDKTAGL